jgi:2'-5' RNA ligase
MAKTVVIDELHVTLRVPADLPADRAAAVRRALTRTAFTARLQRAVNAVRVRAYPALAPVRATLSR